MPNYTLSQALNQYDNDQVATQNMWYVELPGVLEEKLKAVQIYAKDFTIPNRTNDFEEVNYRGYPIPTPTVVKMEQTHSMNVVADVAGQLREGFLAWQARAIDPGIKAGPPSFGADRRPTMGVGAAQIVLNLLAPDYTAILSTVTIYGVRISSVGGYQLSNDSASIATFSVEFKSVYWQLNTVGANYNPDENAMMIPAGAEYVTTGQLNA